MIGSAHIGRRRARAFSLIEVVVAVGILAVVTIAIATVFDSVGKTVSRGASLSTLTRLAFRIETIMQRDFDGLREGTGFLVIRNQYAQSDWDDPRVDLQNDVVPLFDGDANARMRRIDEIAFFSNSDRYRTRRTPLHPSLVAEAGEARIYYGHGQRMPRDVDGNGNVDPYRNDGGAFRSGIDADWRFDRPRLDEFNDVVVPNGSARLGDESTATFTNPNEFASDWLLVRHVTLLHPASLEIQDLPSDVFGMDAVGVSGTAPAQVALARGRVQNSSRQIALQPAAQTVFQPVAALPLRTNEDDALFSSGFGGAWGIRATSTGFANTVTNFYGELTATAGGPAAVSEFNAPPVFASGLVDIATTDLEQVRAFVTTAAAAADSGVSPYTPFEIMTSGRKAFELFENDRLIDPQPNPLRDTSATPSTSTSRADQVQQEWMLAALPSLPFDPANTADDDTPGFRMRAESRPPNLYPPTRFVTGGRVLEREIRYETPGSTYPATARVEDLMAAIEQADQEMLVSNVFIPRCTEFIVEWSYGITDDRAGATRGQLLWHGLRRWEDFTNTPESYDPGDVLVADVFSDADNDGVVEYDGADIRDTIGSGGFNIPDAIRDESFSPAIVQSRLEALSLLRQRTGTNNTNKPDIDTGDTTEYVWGYFDRDANGNTLDWPWPTLVRITLRVIDETDATTEQTYQVIFRVQKPREGEL